MANKYFFLNGGSEKVFFQERDYLLKKHISVIDFSMNHYKNLETKYSEYFVKNVNYHYHRGLARKFRTAISVIHSPEVIRKITTLADKEPPDIAHFHNIYHQLTPSIIPVLKRKGIKIIMTLHDYKLVCPSYLMLKKGKICQECLYGKYYKAFITRCQESLLNGALLSAEAYWHLWKRSYDHVDLFISPSKFLAELITTHRIDQRRVTTLRNGIDVERYEPQYHDSGYVLYFGRLSKEKGIFTLLNAHASCSEIPLKIAGSGPLEKELKDLFINAEFLGYQSGDKLMELVRNSAYVVVPSEWNENCSMVVLEAMALGKPLIGSKVGGIPEQIEDGKTGFLFEMNNTDELVRKMKQLWKNKYLRMKMGRASRRKIEEKFSLQKHCSELLNLYYKVLDIK